MNDYDFSTLNDKEFENISIDLLSIDQGKKFERFKPGKDAGVDGRFYTDDGNEEIIQCKHYLKTGYKGLIAILKKEEKAKVNNLKPKKYFFVTSIPLSRKEKKEIREIFDPYIINDNHIYGQEDLNDLLKTNPDIEENHYKLWLSSTTVLKRIMNNAIKGRSDFQIEDIKSKAKRYVLTENHSKAFDKLNKSHVVIIAGEPGIGKTTLAEHLALKYIEQGYEFFDIQSSLSEAEDVFDPEKKQFFYFDDFLGSNYLNALEFHNDSHVVRFIKRIKNEKNKRFILTSRTNILNQGISLSDTFKNNKLEKDEFVIRVDRLKDIDKGKILYNHIWHSLLDEAYIDELYKKKRYREVIKHKNFNPRLIEFITDIDRLEGVSPKEYWKFIAKKLSNPTDIWSHTFDQGSDDYIRNLVVLVVLNGNRIQEKELLEAYDTMNRLTGLQNYSYASKDFQSVVKTVIKYFLNRNITFKGVVEYSLFNPSIADFVINRYKSNEEKLMYGFLSLQTNECIKSLDGYQYNKMISNQFFQTVLIKLYEEMNIDATKNKIDYALELFYLLELYYKESFQKDKIIGFCRDMIMEPRAFTHYKYFLFLLGQLKRRRELEINNFKFLVPIIESMDYEAENIKAVIKFLNDFKIDDNDIVFALNSAVREYLVYGLDGMMADVGINDVDFDTDEKGWAYVVTDLDQYKDDWIVDLLADIQEYRGMNIDKESIKDEFDTSELKENLAISYMDDPGDYESSGSYSTGYSNDIDDLFER